MTTEQIVTEAKDRFRRCHDWEAVARTRFRFDLKFGMADSTTGDQWPQNTLMDRQRVNKPTLTINKTRQHCLQIVNDARANHAGIVIKPVGSGATYRAAEIFQGLIRHVEYISDAAAAWDCATWNQVFGGIGYVRVMTDYVSDSSFDVMVKIGRIGDPMSVYLDPDIQMYSGEDARFGFIFRDMPKDQFDLEYPKHKDKIGSFSALGEESDSGPAWFSKDHVRVAEYFRKVDEHDTLHYLADGATIRRSEVKETAPGLLEQLDANTVRTRDITTSTVEWYLIGGGDVIIDRNIWPGKYIPIIRVVGEETVMDGVMDRRGHVRAMIDPQRIYNYWSSSTVEQVALQTRIPFTGPAQAIEGLETYYENVNLVNSAYLPYRQYDDQGREMHRPERINPPQMAQAYVEGLKISSQEMQDVSGQFEATFGEPSNERSGKAIDARSRNAARSTFHYVDHLSQAIRYCGKIMIDLLPKVLDTERVMRIIGNDGATLNVKIDPNAPKAHQDVEMADSHEKFSEEEINLIFNPNVGDYTIVADVGASYETKREHFTEAMTQILTQNHDVFPLVADLYFRNLDVPGADELADRMLRMVPPQALGKGPSAEEQKMQQLLQQQHQMIEGLAGKLKEQDAQAKEAELSKEIEFFKAQTDRMAAAGKIDQAALQPIIREMVSQMLGIPVNQLIGAHLMEHAEMQQKAAAPPPQPGMPLPQEQGGLPEQPMQPPPPPGAEEMPPEGMPQGPMQ